jgi:hydroxysqualene dehydroxylase
MTERPDAVIIGGGFAGLSAAVALCRRGLRVAVLESKPALGGRAYSFTDPQTGDFVDNGQHVLLGCYTETLDFLARIGARPSLVFQPDLEIEMIDRAGSSARLKAVRVPGPLHMSGALLRYRHLVMRDRIRAMAAGLKMLAMRRGERGRLEEMTVAGLMDELGQSERARACFWYPLAIATLNDRPEFCSAALLAEVLKRGFFARRADSAFVYSRVGLSDLYCTGAAAFIERAGSTIALRCNVEALEMEDGRVARAKLRDGGEVEAPNFIVTVPAHRVLQMIPEAVRADPFFARISGLRSSPIICVHAWFDRPVTASACVGFVGTTTQWLFNKRRIFARRGERHPGYLSFVISGARDIIDRSSEEILAIVLGDLNRMIPAAREAKLTRSLVLKEKHATMAPAPETFRLRPTTRTPIPNFFLAGDWIQTALPATIESAVISGHAAAEAVAERRAQAMARAA